MKITIKRCPKCISEGISKYYPSVGKMNRTYNRDNEKWIPIGWYCEEHDYFISDKSINVDNNQQILEDIVYNNNFPGTKQEKIN